LKRGAIIKPASGRLSSERLLTYGAELTLGVLTAAGFAGARRRRVAGAELTLGVLTAAARAWRLGKVDSTPPPLKRWATHAEAMGHPANQSPERERRVGSHPSLALGALKDANATLEDLDPFGVDIGE